MKRMRHFRSASCALAAGLCITTALPCAAAIPLCGGDCNGDGRVAVHELVTVAGALLHNEPVARCSAADNNEDGRFRINELVNGVGHALAECPSARVDALVGRVVGEGTPGMAIMVIDHGQILHSRGYGMADVAAGIPMTPQTHTGLASITKTFTALAVLMLAERQEIGLDDPVAMYLPELTRFGTGLSIRHLLTHTGGLPDYFVDDTELYARWLEVEPAVAARAVGLLFPYPADPVLFGELLSGARLLTSLDLASILSDYGELLFTPGDAYAYSNTGYDLLGGIIERVSGQTYDHFVTQNILEPLGMTGSFLLPGDGRLSDPDVATLYGLHGDTVVPYPDLPWLAATGSGELYSSLEELFAYDQALYDDTLVSQATLAAAFAPHLLNDGSVAGDSLGQQGLGWQIVELYGERAVWHAGGGFGIDAALLRFVDRQLTFISLLNTEDRGAGHYAALLGTIALYMDEQDARR